MTNRKPLLSISLTNIDPATFQITLNVILITFASVLDFFLPLAVVAGLLVRGERTLLRTEPTMISDCLSIVQQISASKHFATIAFVAALLLGHVVLMLWLGKKYTFPGNWWVIALGGVAPISIVMMAWKGIKNAQRSRALKTPLGINKRWLRIWLAAGCISIIGILMRLPYGDIPCREHAIICGRLSELLACFWCIAFALFTCTGNMMFPSWADPLPPVQMRDALCKKCRKRPTCRMTAATAKWKAQPLSDC
jgi:hypothetical protein